VGGSGVVSAALLVHTSRMRRAPLGRVPDLLQQASGLTRARRQATVNLVVHHQFAALGDPTRLAIVERLARGPTSASDLAAPTTISLPAVLKHVRVLEEAGLVTTVKRGRVRECRLREDALVAVATWTAQQQALWSTRLDALGTLLEDT
jgi:DNA-binding transcriptional ArsR family regulator